MRRILGFFVCTVVGIAFAQSSQKPFSIALSSDQPVVKAGWDVWVRIKMTNTSSGSVDCSTASSNGLDLRYSFEISDSSGNKIDKVRSSHPELEGTGSFRLCTLAPGQSTSPDENLLSREYDLSKPGTYTVQVSRGISRDEKKGVVKSNPITITVTP